MIAFLLLGSLFLNPNLHMAGCHSCGREPSGTMVLLRRRHVVLLLFLDLFHDNCDAFATTTLLHPTQSSRRRLRTSSRHTVKRRCPSISPSAMEMTSTAGGGGVTKPIIPDSTSSRLKRKTDFLNWATANDIKYASFC